MTIDEQIELEIQIREEIRLLEDEIADAEEHLAPPSQLDGTEGRLSRQDSLQQHEIAKAAQTRRTLRLSQLQSALTRLDEGTFGFCANCGREIAYQRLLARPETLLCETCL